MGFTTSNTFNHPITQRIMELQEALDYTPWYHFMERFYLKSELQELEKEAFFIGFEIALKDLQDMGFLVPLHQENHDK